MADILMTYSSLEEAANGVDRAKADLEEVIALLDRTVSALEGSWSGESYEALVNAWGSSKPTVQKLAEAVAAFAPEIRGAAERQRETESASASRIQSTSF